MIAPAEAVDVVRRESARFDALLRGVPHDVSVPHLPRWTVGHLGAHLLGDFVWATRILTSRAAPRSGLRASRLRGEALCDRFTEAAAAMVAALEAAAADPGAPCPNFAEGEQGALGWWPRHQAHETTLHRWDLERAAGVPGPIDPALAADGVDELLHVYTARYAPHVLRVPLVLRAETDDGARRWLLAPRPGRGLAVERDRTSTAVPELGADPETLLLLLWRRRGVDEVPAGVDGGPEAVDALRALVAGPVTA